MGEGEENMSKKLDIYPAPGMGDLLPGWFAVPQNPLSVGYRGAYTSENSKRVCAYCRSEKKTDRCESCGATLTNYETTMKTDDLIKYALLGLGVYICGK